jgi:uncharacterized protein DUF3307
VPWVEVFAVLIVSHLAGDFLLQTDWQATHKSNGLGRDQVARRALLAHGATYTLALVPALIWLATELGGWALGVGALVVLPHLIQDDGRLLGAYMRRVKGLEPRPGVLLMAIDQSSHLLALFAVALLAGS